MKRTANDLYTQYPGNVFVKIVALEMSLHGDPAGRVNNLRKPDLEVLDPYVSFIPGSVSTDLDSFEVQIAIANNGRTFSDSFNVEVVRKYAKFGKENDVYSIPLAPINFRDTITLKMPTDRVYGPGLNFISISIDPSNFIDELTNTNNNLTKTLLISTGEILPVYPTEFAVIPQNNTWLKATTGDPFAPEKRYKFEIDTTDFWIHPAKRDTIIQQTGGVVKWKPSIQFPDSMVYFWRAGVDSSGTGTFYRWKESSFQYINGKRGWGQSRFYQIQE